MRFQLSRCTPVATLVAVSALSFQALAQSTPAAATSPAGSGSASNAALGGRSLRVPRRDCRTASRISPECGKAAVRSATSKTACCPAKRSRCCPTAEKLMKSRLSSEDPEARCLPTGVPRVAPYPWRILQTPSYGDAKILYILFEGNIHSYRQIFVDGRGHPDDLEATWYGHSVGHWEGDTLVVETVGFNDKFWFDFVGHPHTTQLQDGRALHAHGRRDARERHHHHRSRRVQEAVHREVHGDAAARLGPDGIHLQREQSGRRAPQGARGALARATPGAFCRARHSGRRPTARTSVDCD